MTTPNTDLAEQIAVALYNNAEYYGPEDVQPGWECLGDEEREEWRLIAAAVMPIVEAAVKRGQAEALRDAARHIEHVVRANPERVFTEHVLDDNGGPGYLRELANEIDQETPDEQ